MALRLTLIAHGATAATRAARFPRDEPLEDRAVPRVRALAHHLPRTDRAVASPALRARQTVEFLGLAAEIDDDLRDCDHGRWAGLRLDAVAAAEPDAVAAWLSDPEAAPHGGESIAALILRNARWLDRQVAGAAPARLVAVTHAAIVRAAIVNVLAAPASAFWRIDVAPLSCTEIVADAGRWTLHRMAATRTANDPAD